MGFGEVIGNQSVHWRVLHEEYEDGAQGAAAATAKRLHRKTARARLRTANVPPDKPAEHVANLDVLDFEARGTDTVPFDQIGKCNGTKEHSGCFRVSMRFRTLKEAKAAVLRQRIRREGTTYVLRVDVPAIQRTDTQVGPPPDPPAEVRVDW
jgi:hypothetical protein